MTMPNETAPNNKIDGAMRPLTRDFTSLTECIGMTSDAGGFFRFTAEEPKARHVFSLDELKEIKGFTACHRYEPFWMKPMAGTRAGEVPIETQFLLAELEDGNCTLFVPLIDGGFRCALQGAGENGLELVAESGDPAVVTTEVVGLFIAVGGNPNTLVGDSAVIVSEHLGTGRLRYDKPEPDFADYFGWCTWDAFYQEVSHDKIREGLESFKAGGITPKVIILDDGWQSVQKLPSGERRLTSFAANEKFPGDLAPTVTMAKEEFGVEMFLVWHALNGYWGGVDGDALPGYGVRSMERRFSEGILHHVPTITDWWGRVMGVVPPEHIYRFFQDYHRHLRRQGVDGVKVDNQSALEGVAYGFGGRVAAMRAYHEALEGSAQVHFQGELINCMSCSSEMLYSGLNSNIVRTSTDFWPNRPGSHGLHLYTNAQVSLWFGEFFQPDWDMFQSGHPAGAYHAAARALSGGPVYVSDKPGSHNFDLLRKLVYPDGKVPKGMFPGVPTRDCLFRDPTREDVLLKIFNLGYRSGMVGAFNARYDEEKEIIVTGEVGVFDLDDNLDGERFAVYAHYAQTLHVMQRDERLPVTLKPLECELFTFVPIENGFAPIGLTEMFNSHYAVMPRSKVTAFTLRSGGPVLVWCENPPVGVEFKGTPIDFSYDPKDGSLRFTAPPETDFSEVHIRFA